MEELNLVPCESLDALASRLNAELENGRAIEFHNFNGMFIKDPDGASLIYELWPRYSGGRYVLALYRLWEWVPNFFRAASKQFLECGEKINALSFGTTRRPFGLDLTNWICNNLDSLQYGPTSGVMSRKNDGTDEFCFPKPVDRIYWKK
jgi:hypothetical protein